MSTKEGRKAVVPEAPAAGANKFTHLMSSNERLAAENERRDPVAVAAKIIEAGRKRRGEIQ